MTNPKSWFLRPPAGYGKAVESDPGKDSLIARGTRVTKRRRLHWLGVVFAGPTLLTAGLAGIVAGGASAVAVAGSVSVPTVQGPIGQVGKGFPYNSSPWNLDDYGYMEEEYFLSGVAVSYGTPVPAPAVSASQPAPYTTRILIERPRDPRRANGVVVMDWVNVSAQMEQPADWYWAHNAMMDRGYTYVFVSAQQAGVDQIKRWDPTRYAALNHPGDNYALDIFSQVAQALRHTGTTKVTGSAPVRRIIATGHSQSALYLHDYVNKVQPIARVLDGFLIDADFGGGTSFPNAPVPVLQLLSEESAVPSNQTSAPNYRLWEVAGAAHTDFYYSKIAGQYSNRNNGSAPISRADQEAAEQSFGDYGTTGLTSLQTACLVGGDQAPRRYAVNAALVGLDQWSSGRGAPPVAPTFDFTTLPTAPIAPILQGTPGLLLGPTLEAAINRDADGNAIGGYRLPPLDVPVATYLGSACNQAGITVTFLPTILAQRYPTHAHYVQALQQVTDRAVSQRFLLPEDGADLMTRANASLIPDLPPPSVPSAP
jgi:hypothetical protein